MSKLNRTVFAIFATLIAVALAVCIVIGTIWLIFAKFALWAGIVMLFAVAWLFAAVMVLALIYINKE